MRLAITVLSVLVFLSGSLGYRILGIFPFHAKSHFVMFEPMMKSLAKRGHQVDVISAFPLKKTYPNYTDLVTIEPSFQVVNNFSYADVKRVMGTLVVNAVTSLGGNDVCAHLGHPDILEIVRNPPRNPPYDAVIMEVFGAHCFGIIAHLLNVPLIGASSSALYPWSNDIIANPENLAFMPNNLLSFPNEMNFWNRLINVVHTIFNKIYFNTVTGSTQDAIIKQHFGEGLPSVREIERSIAMILVNSHISMSGIRPMTPAVIEVGGLHIQEDDVQLSPGLEKWMNESNHGFLYFTFGSMVQIETFPSKYLDIFYKSLGKISPVRVLMKVTNSSLLPAGLPTNIHTVSWLPQVKVLKHRNVKAFITHGGLMGTQEAIHYGVPLIGIPLFADQFINIDTYVLKNIAVKIDLETITEEKMDRALNAILKDPIYRESMKDVSRRFQDRPMSPLDTAIFWIEYVIRNGADCLRSPAMDLSWWQVQLLDVYAFLVAATLIIVVVLTIILKFLIDIASFGTGSARVSREKKIR